MTKDNQIKEMTITMLEASTSANVEPVLEIDGKEVVLGENATKILNNILEQAFIPFLAETLYKQGYRKASDIAREIFEEIENSISPMLGLEDDKEYVAILTTTFVELKKKYTESEKDK